MNNKRKFVLRDIETNEYYAGKIYQVQGEIYPYVTKDIAKAKIYTTQATAFKGETAVNEKCGYSTFEVVPFDYINKPNEIITTRFKEDNSIKTNENFRKNTVEAINDMMTISKEDLRFLLEMTFRRGMEYGYGVEHTNKTEDENKAWEEYSKTIKELQ